MAIYKLFSPVMVVQWRESPQNFSCGILEICLISAISYSFPRMPCLLNSWLMASGGREPLREGWQDTEAEEENLGGHLCGELVLI